MDTAEIVKGRSRARQLFHCYFRNRDLCSSYATICILVQIELLVYREGDRAPFNSWLSSLKDLRAVSIVRARLNRIRIGNFGDCKAVGGGVEELRIDFGPGYRIYFGRDNSLIVVLLCGGSKRSQASDIVKAQRYWKDYLNAKRSG